MLPATEQTKGTRVFVTDERFDNHNRHNCHEHGLLVLVLGVDHGTTQTTLGGLVHGVRPVLRDPFAVVLFHSHHAGTPGLGVVQEGMGDLRKRRHRRRFLVLSIGVFDAQTGGYSVLDHAGKVLEIRIGTRWKQFADRGDPSQVGMFPFLSVPNISERNPAPGGSLPRIDVCRAVLPPQVAPETNVLGKTRQVVQSQETTPRPGKIR